MIGRGPKFANFSWLGLERARIEIRPKTITPQVIVQKRAEFSRKVKRWSDQRRQWEFIILVYSFERRKRNLKFLSPIFFHKHLFRFLKLEEAKKVHNHLNTIQIQYTNRQTTLTNLMGPLKKSFFQTISWSASRYLKVVNPHAWHQSR